MRHCNCNREIDDLRRMCDTCEREEERRKEDEVIEGFLSDVRNATKPLHRNLTMAIMQESTTHQLN